MTLPRPIFSAPVAGPAPAAPGEGVVGVTEKLKTIPEEAGDDVHERVQYVRTHTHTSVDDEGGSVRFHNRTTRVNLHSTPLPQLPNY